MKSLNKLFIILAAVGLSFTACDNNNSSGENDGDIPSVAVNTQGTSSGNQVVISNVVSPENGWIVIHRSNADGNGPQVPEIIGKAMVEAGTNTDVSIQLEEGVQNNETLWAMLHEDTGTIGEYEFDGSSGLDLPVTLNDEIVMTSFSISQTDPSITSMDQVNRGNIFRITSVSAAEDGWIVIHGPNANNDGPQIPEIIGKAPVTAGVNENVEIVLNEGAEVSTGDNLFPMLHYDTGTIGEYEFDGNSGLDLPVITPAGDIVLTSFEVIENMSTITAEDQMVMDNSISVDVESDTDGWIVVHASNANNDGPQIPEIIGKAPISEGMNTDVQITFNEGVVVEDGDVLYPMAHYDTGVIGEYEFDGAGPHDQPVITANGILLTSITVSGSASPAVMVENQTAEDGMITISETMTNQIGFVVLHRDTGSDSPVVPASIGHGQVYTGANNDLVIELDEGETVESGEKVWAMLHIDNGTIGSYDFDGSEGSDDPPVFDEMQNIVMVQFTIE
ncbi:MAG: hypothetical protein CL667_12570 [Balneola sp.]|nr:hypothetical protein [Balneola sp.]|tara:strand:- start:42529 stop:44043 length:1515 start_codon:yes stop_codon:yes gene_type:complete